MPSVFNTKEKDMVIVDPAGFNDTKGLAQEIINSYANAKMFKRGGKTKVILVIDISSLLSSRGGVFTNLMKRLMELFPQDFKSMVNSIMLVVSKTDTCDEKVVIKRIG